MDKAVEAIDAKFGEGYSKRILILLQDIWKLQEENY